MFNPSLLSIVVLFHLCCSSCFGFIFIDHEVTDNYNPSDSIWPVIRNNFKLQSGTNIPKVRALIKWYQSHPENLEAIFAQSKPYLAYITQECIKNNLPTELALIPAIESAFNPLAHSKAGASGLWQMMPGTASAQNVPIDWWYDGRRDIIDATSGALTYLQWLHKNSHNKWNFAIAAYDAGLGRVKRSYNIQSTASNYYQFHKLPLETQNYLYKLLAIKSIIESPKKHGHKLPSITFKAPFISIKTKYPIHLKELHSFCHFDPHPLNRGFRRWISSPTATKHIHVLRKHSECTLRFLQKNSINYLHGRKAIWRLHTVAKGESLYTIAKHHQTTVNNIKTANKLTINTIKPSKILLIPSHFTQRIKSPPLLSESFKSTITGNYHNSHKQITHIIQKNDNLSMIANKYNTKKSHIIYWNTLKSSKLKIGDKLIIWKPPLPSKTLRKRRRKS